MSKFREGLAELSEETGITVQATLNYTIQGIQPTLSMRPLEELQAQANEEPQDDPEPTDTDESEDIVVAEGEE